MTKKLLILTTGGTIASVETPHGLIPALTSEELLSYLPEIGDDFVLTTKAVCNLDSTDMTPDHWLLLARTIREEYEQYDGFVICHGTDTLAYTAAALSYLIQNSPKPIVLTGAQKPIGQEITDAKANLRDSILYAADSLEKELFAQLQKYAPEEKVLVMTTQVTYEGSNIGTYEVGRRLRESFQILEARDMTLEAVLTKMMWVLSEENLTWQDICRRFYSRIDSDTLLD